MSGSKIPTKIPSRRSRCAKDGPVPAVTILVHPEVQRIGERLLVLDQDELAISRLTPDFAPPRKLWGRPLEDGYISREPFRLTFAADGGVTLDRARTQTEIRVQGEPLETSRCFDHEAIAAGITIELTERILLLLHHVLPESDAAVPAYGLVGESAAICRVRREIQQIADLEVAVLLRGESGTGKELVARAIHESSPRRSDKLVSVNMGSLPQALAAGELFGHVKGAFTGAVQARMGYFRTADGGTLFLDEIGETPAEVQVMLLRTLETGEVYPVGSQAPQRVDVRLIAATDADLEHMAADGTFKLPLLHRLDSYEIWLPPLRDRKDDIGRLFLHFAEDALTELGEQGRLDGANLDAMPWLPTDLMERMCRFSWPGNVRQLRNLVRQLVIQSRGREQLIGGARIDRLFDEEAAVEKEEEAPSEPAVKTRKPSQVGQAELVRALRNNRWDLAATAKQLGIKRPAVYDLIQKNPRLHTAEDLSATRIQAVLDAMDGDVERAADELEVSSRALRRRIGKLRIRNDG